VTSTNLIPAARLIRKHRRTRLATWVKICLTYAALLAFALGASRWIWDCDEEAVSRQLEAVSQEITASGNAITEMKSELAEVRVALNAARAVGNQPDWSALLVLLTQKLGDHIVLDTCELKPLIEKQTETKSGSGSSETPVTQVPLGQQRYELILSGFGRTQTAVSQFVLRLERIDLLSTVKLTRSTRGRFMNGEAVAFCIECSI